MRAALPLLEHSEDVMRSTYFASSEIPCGNTVGKFKNIGFLKNQCSDPAHDILEPALSEQVALTTASDGLHIAKCFSQHQQGAFDG